MKPYLLQTLKELALLGAIKNRIEIKGDKKKALKFVKPIDRLNSCLRNIDTEY